MEQVFVELTELCTIKDEWQAGTVPSGKVLLQGATRTLGNANQVIPFSQELPRMYRLNYHDNNFLSKKVDVSNGFPFHIRNIDRFFGMA
jgi:hypothetical protein